METKKVARAVILTALAVGLSTFSIPVGISRVFPGQHLVNVLSAVMLGPWYAVTIAAAVAIIRNVTGLGTPLAFPGGMIGALLAGMMYRYCSSIYMAALGEVMGTGLIGALVSVLFVAPVFMGKTMPMLTIIIAFSASTIVGSVLGVLGLHVLSKAGFREVYDHSS